MGTEDTGKKTIHQLEQRKTAGGKVTDINTALADDFDLTFDEAMCRLDALLEDSTSFAITRKGSGVVFSSFFLSVLNLTSLKSTVIVGGRNPIVTDDAIQPHT